MKTILAIIAFVFGATVFLVMLISYGLELHRQDLINKGNAIGNATMKSFETDIIPYSAKNVMINGELHIFLNPNASRTGPSCGDISTDPQQERMRVDCEKEMYRDTGKTCPVDVCTMNIPHGAPEPDLCTIYLDDTHCPGNGGEYDIGPSGCAYTIPYNGMTDCIGMEYPSKGIMSFEVKDQNGKKVVLIVNGTDMYINGTKPNGIIASQPHNGTLGASGNKSNLEFGDIGESGLFYIEPDRGRSGIP